MQSCGCGRKLPQLRICGKTIPHSAAMAMRFHTAAFHAGFSDFFPQPCPKSFFPTPRSERGKYRPLVPEITQRARNGFVIDFIPGRYRYMGHNKYTFLDASCVNCWRRSHNKPCAHEMLPNLISQVAVPVLLGRRI